MGALLDMCPTGDLGWTSDENNDRDGDGCRDATEDNDDDGDEVADNVDNCSPGPLGWQLNWQSVPSTDLDGDGCITREEWLGSDAVFDALDHDHDGRLLQEDVRCGLGAALALSKI